MDRCVHDVIMMFNVCLYDLFNEREKGEEMAEPPDNKIILLSLTLHGPSTRVVWSGAFIANTLDDFPSGEEADDGGGRGPTRHFWKAMICVCGGEWIELADPCDAWTFNTAILLTTFEKEQNDSWDIQVALSTLRVASSCTMDERMNE